MHSGSGSQDTITYVIKRLGSREEFDATKLIRRSERLLSGLDKQNLEIKCLVEATVTGAISGIATVKLDELMAQTAAYLGTKHPDYASLAGRLSVTALHKITPGSFSEAIEKMYRFVNPKTKQHAPLVSKELYEIVCSHAKHFDSVIQIDRDLLFDYFGFKTLERSYLISVEDANGARIPIERPQYMWLRVSIGIHHDNFERIEETYHAMSRGFFTHASPTLFNAGTNCPQMSSCFLVALKDDSIEGIYDTLTECALISKSSGGIGLHIHNLRATHSYIRGTNGKSNGIVPVLRVFNDTSRYVDQGGGKRKGSFAIYLEPWHADIVEFLQLKKNTGKDELRARDLFYALWIPDLFMKRVMEKGKWTLFDPNTAPGLSDCWGSEFERLYETYEQEERGVRVVEAQEIWFAIIESQIETGTPYMLYKDSCNAKSNQQNLGTIKCSNLCTEIIEFTSPEETAVCNLASIALPKFCVRKGSSEGLSFDFEELRKITRIATRNLNRVIDRNYYPVPSARRSNLRHRPIGLGVQGLADVFMTLRLPFTSPDAQQLNEDIFETIYYAALEESCVLAQEEGTYESYQGSPVSKGILQHDMWGKKPRTSRWDWNRLRADIAQHGVRNSLLVAPMPTASTSQILGNNECFEPYTSNIYLRRVLSGEFPIVNKFLVRDLIKEGLWNDRTRNAIIASNGSVQKIEGLSSDLKNIYRTVWEIKQKDIIDMAAARAAYIDQSHSLNLFLENPTSNTLTSMHFYAWRIGLKTGMYYLRTRPAADAIKFTVDVDMLKQSTSENQTVPAADEPCLSCGS